MFRIMYFRQSFQLKLCKHFFFPSVPTICPSHLDFLFHRNVCPGWDILWPLVVNFLRLLSSPWVQLRSSSLPLCHLLMSRLSEQIYWIEPSLHNIKITTLIKIQPDATVCRYLFTEKLHYMFRVSQHPSLGVLKTVTAASGTRHNIGTATSLQRGLIMPRWREVAVPVLWPVPEAAVTVFSTPNDGCCDTLNM